MYSSIAIRYGNRIILPSPLKRDSMDLNSMLSMPVSFVTSAQKRGWNAVNFRVSPNSVYLIQDEWRVRFYRGEEKKFWTLERSGENGWIEIHTVFHPGSSRLDWVLVTFKKIMVHFERMKFTTTIED